MFFENDLGETLGVPKTRPFSLGLLTWFLLLLLLSPLLVLPLSLHLYGPQRCTKRAYEDCNVGCCVEDARCVRRATNYSQCVPVCLSGESALEKAAARLRRPAFYGRRTFGNAFHVRTKVLFALNGSG